MILLKRTLQKFKGWLNESHEPKYLSGKNRAVKHARNKQKYLSGKNKKENL
tara:strand:+ start:563 stop:715 length:153 start_codon:yes stop_codon:yes gene_type:complete